MPSDTAVALLLDLLDEAFDRKAWHGTNLRGSVRRLDARSAAWRPGPDRHSAWELTVHAAYWKYAVRRRIEGGARGAFPRRPSNWPRIPARPDAKAWRDDLVLLVAEHRALHEVVALLSPARLSERSPKKTWTLANQIHGVAAHDVYHTGQIQMLKRLGATGRR